MQSMEQLHEFQFQLNVGNSMLSVGKFCNGIDQHQIPVLESVLQLQLQFIAIGGNSKGF